MLDRSRISLNRSICPGVNLEDFFKLAAELEVSKVELRNDLPDRGIIDRYASEHVRKLAAQYKIQIIAINAIQNFNVGSLLPMLLEQLQELAQLATTIGDQGIVLCPRHSVKDTRNPEQCLHDTVKALKEFAPLFTEHKLIGYIKPLGFETSTLQSGITAIQAIQDSGAPHYKIVHDTFHYYIGTDTVETFPNEYDVSYIGLIHVSGVEHEISKHLYHDTHRGLITPADKLHSREQIAKLIALGYAGDISLEPSIAYGQQVDREELKTAIHNSIAYLLEAEVIHP
jgi:2-keto-myo-inositol isomerase